ncbi:MAG: DEAD/DEAH box helicase [Actinomycetota bacterium]|nr:DEAD/DEAH box helicase [Actinomycetota bacterium]
MDRPNTINRWALAREEIANILDPLLIESAYLAAVGSWMDRVVRGSRAIEIDRDIIQRAYRVTVLARSSPLEFDESEQEIYAVVERTAAIIDIYSRFGGGGKLARLAASLYHLAMQPTKAYRVSRILRDDGETVDANALAARAAEAYAAAATPDGVRALSRTARILLDVRNQLVPVQARNEESHDAADLIDELMNVTLEEHEAELHAWLVDIAVAARFRQGHDIRVSVDGRVGREYLRRALGATRFRDRRSELLPVQRWAVREGLLDGRVVSIGTPTGSGKTFTAELRIATELEADSTNLCVYVAPLNALANQVVRDLRARLEPSGWIVQLWTGAYELSPVIDELGNVLVTTPEKLDFILRGRFEGDELASSLVARCGLVIFDEAHMTSAGVRGIRYELLMQRIQSLLPDARILTMSAVQRNPEVLSAWFGGDEGVSIPVAWRPSTVWDVLWRRNGSLVVRESSEPPFVFPRPAAPRAAAAQLAAHLLERLRSVLLVDTRREWAEALARELYRSYRDTLADRLARNVARRPDVQSRLHRVSSDVRRQIHPSYPLADFVLEGLAFHHSGLPPSIRRAIEDLAREEIIHTLVSTTTLAEGVNLPFRAAILVHLNLPFGALRPETIENIRGRAARPFYANDGFFFIVEPENTETATYQAFLDNYWAHTGPREQSISSLPQLVSYLPSTRREAARALQAQLLALYGEQEIEASESAAIAGDTLLASTRGRRDLTVRRVAAAIASETERMMAEPALLVAASPIQLTAFGSSVMLGGISADSGRVVRHALLQAADELAASLRHPNWSWFAVRCAWLPWEAVEQSPAYTAASHGPGNRGFVRTTESLVNLEDRRLQDDYHLSDFLLTPQTYAEVAEHKDLQRLAGRTTDARLVSAIEWASGKGQLLSWTLTGVIRIAERLGRENEFLALLALGLTPYVDYLQHWLPWPLGIELIRTEIVDRDAAIRLLRTSGFAETGTYSDLAAWARENRAVAEEIIGSEGLERLLRLDVTPDK